MVYIPLKLPHKRVRERDSAGRAMVTLFKGCDFRRYSFSALHLELGEFVSIPILILHARPFLPSPRALVLSLSRFRRVFRIFERSCIRTCGSLAPAGTFPSTLFVCTTHGAGASEF